MFNGKLLENRLLAEVQYLRDQNTKLLDRLLAMMDSKAYAEIKQMEAKEEAQKIQKTRVEKMSSEDFTKELKRHEEHEAKTKVLNLQLSQMMGGDLAQ